MHPKFSINPPLQKRQTNKQTNKQPSPNYCSANKGEIVLINQEEKNLCGLIREGPDGSFRW